MRFRSARCSFPHFARFARFGAASLAAIGIAGTSAHATLTVVPANVGGSTSPDNVLYYAGSTTGTPTGYVLDGGFSALDLTRSFVLESGSLANAFSFNVTSTLTTAAAAGSNYYLVVTLTPSQGGTVSYPVAIAGSGGGTCSSPSCLYSSSTATDPEVGGLADKHYYFAVPYTPSLSPMLVALYPKDICTSYSVTNGQNIANGCIVDSTDAGHWTIGTQTAAGASVPALALNFQVVAIPGPVTTLPATLPTAADQVSVTVRFEDNSRPTTSLVCPSTPVPYSPGDGQIIVDTTFLNPNTQATPSGYAPITATVLAGRANSNLTDTTGSGTSFNAGQPASYPGSYIVFGSTGVGSNETVGKGGFSNITAASDPAHSYDVGFLARDAAGMLYAPTAAGGGKNGCVLVGVQTSTIQGFLSKSSCFIATAAFRSVDASPVSMLRQFRDQILLKSELGTEFVHWYYHWSPPAAEWLMRHPQARWPVLEALVPVEVVAWFMLHPVQLTLFFVFAISALATGLVFAVVMRAKGRTQQ